MALDRSDWRVNSAISSHRGALRRAREYAARTPHQAGQPRWPQNRPATAAFFLEQAADARRFLARILAASRRAA